MLQIYEVSLVTVSLSAPPPFPILVLQAEALQNKTSAASLNVTSESRDRKTESQPPGHTHHGSQMHIFIDTWDTMYTMIAVLVGIITHCTGSSKRGFISHWVNLDIQYEFTLTFPQHKGKTRSGAVVVQDPCSFWTCNSQLSWSGSFTAPGRKQNTCGKQRQLFTRTSNNSTAHQGATLTVTVCPGC